MLELGNHEDRYERFLRIKAPELLDIQEFRLDILLKFGELGVQLIDEMRIVQFGRLNIMHGHEFGKSVFSPVNPARGAYMRAKENCIIVGKFLAPLQGFASYKSIIPRALPWAGMYGPFGARLNCE